MNRSTVCIDRSTIGVYAHTSANFAASSWQQEG